MVSSWSPGGLLLVLVLVVSWCSSALLVVSCWSFGRLLVSRRSLASLSVVLLVVSCSWSLSSWSPWSQRSSWVVTWRRCRKPQLATSCDLCFPEQFRAVYGLSLFGGLCWHIGSGYAVRNLLGTVRRQHVVILSLKSCIFYCSFRRQRARSTTTSSPSTRWHNNTEFKFPRSLRMLDNFRHDRLHS